MSQIEITVLKQGIHTGHVVSTSFFKMVNGYRDFSKYEMFLKRFLEQSRRLKDFEVRIYTDDSASDICLTLTQKYPSVSVYRYNCPDFREGNGHTGTFGTIVRFLPLFEKELKTVWVSDVDISSDFLDPNILAMMKKHNCQVFIDSMLCYSRRPWANVKYPIVAHRFISHIAFPRQILTKFLKKLASGELSDMITTINQYNARKSENLRFPYGMDEVFINGILYRNLKKHDANILFRVDYFIPNLVAYNVPNFPKEADTVLERYYREKTPDLFRKSKEIFRKYVPMILNKYPCAVEVLNVLDGLKTSFTLIKVVSSSDL